MIPIICTKLMPNDKVESFLVQEHVLFHQLDEREQKREQLTGQVKNTDKDWKTQGVSAKYGNPLCQ